MFPYGMTPKPAPSMRARICNALRQGPANGQAELGQRLGLKDLAEWNTFTETMRSMLIKPVELIEEKRQLPSTGIDGPPVFEYIYRNLPNR